MEMRKLVVAESLTLDGVFECPDKSPNDTFIHAGWSEPYANEEQMQYISENMAGGDTLLFGRVTYQRLQAGWEPQSGPFADYMNNVKKYVVSTTLNKAEWNNSTLIQANVVEEIAKLKEQPGKDIAVLGSGALARTLMEHDLVDEYRLLLYPVVLGSGKRFFEDCDKEPLRLQKVKPFSTGVTSLSYMLDIHSKD
jgi:dihydrofolate reductase